MAKGSPYGEAKPVDGLGRVYADKVHKSYNEAAAAARRTKTGIITKLNTLIPSSTGRDPFFRDTPSSRSGASANRTFKDDLRCEVKYMSEDAGDFLVWIDNPIELIHKCCSEVNADIGRFFYRMVAGGAVEGGDDRVARFVREMLYPHDYKDKNHLHFYEVEIAPRPAEDPENKNQCGYGTRFFLVNPQQTTPRQFIEIRKDNSARPNRGHLVSSRVKYQGSKAGVTEVFGWSDENVPLPALWPKAKEITDYWIDDEGADPDLRPWRDIVADIIYCVLITIDYINEKIGERICDDRTEHMRRRQQSEVEDSIKEMNPDYVRRLRVGGAGASKVRKNHKKRKTIKKIKNKKTKKRRTKKGRKTRRYK